MSNEAMAWALRADLTGKLSAEHRLVLVTLADYARPDTAEAWPSRATIADRLGTSVRSVARALERLERAGLISRGDQAHVAHLRKDRRPVVYVLRVGGRARPPVDESMLDMAGLGPDSEGHGVTDVSPGEPDSRGDSSVTPVDKRGDTCGTHGVTAVSPKPTTRTNYPPVVPPATTEPRSVDNPGRRPDGTCRRCDDPHPPGVACRPVGDPVAGMAKVRAALAEARAREAEE